jgi:hypothetical protein
MAGRGQADFDTDIGPIAEPADLRGDHIDAALKLLVLWSDLARCGRVWKLRRRRAGVIGTCALPGMDVNKWRRVI